MSRAAVRAAVAVLTLLLALPAAPTPALAHAIVLESSPAHDAVLPEAPTRLVLRFNSRIEAALSRVTIEPSAGRPVALRVATEAASAADRLVVPLQPLTPGVYIVRYRVLAADGHVTEGALRFTVKAP